MSDNPRHPALRSHKVKKSQGHYGDYVFEADIIQKYRLTWEYGPEKGWISLRNIDNHDECLTKP